MSDSIAIPAPAKPVKKQAAPKAPKKENQAEAAPKQPSVQPEAAGTQTKPVPQREAVPGAANSTFVRKPVGDYNFPLKDVPTEFRETAQSRFGRAGVAMSMTTSKANGSYKGEVLNSDKYMAQRVGDNSVVFHKKSDVELVSNDSQWRDQNKTLNRANLALHYDGMKAKAYPHDPERENLTKMVNAMKKAAEHIGVPDLDKFKKNLDAVQGVMWDQLKERRKVEPAKNRPQPQQERSQERSR